MNHFNFVCRFTKEVIQVKKVGFVMNVEMFLAGNKLWIFTNPNIVANTISFVHIVIVVLTAKQFCMSTVWLIQARTSSDLDGTLYLFSIYEISMCTLEVGGVEIINVFSKTSCQDLSKYCGVKHFFFEFSRICVLSCSNPVIFYKWKILYFSA